MKFLFFLCLNIYILFLIQSAIAEFTYIPPSKEIDIIDGGSYRFGIVEDDTTNITRCDYKSDTGIEGYFVVVKKALTEPPPTAESSFILENPLQFDDVDHESFEQFHSNRVTAEHNEVTHSGQAGLCQMTIRQVDDKGPTTWSLITYNNNTEEPTLPGITYKVNFFYKPPFLQEGISIYESENFFQYLNVTNINFKFCELAFNNSTIELDMHSSRTNSFLTPYTKETKATADKISSFGRGLCGFKLENATTAESLLWTITATDDKGKRYRASFRSVILSKIDSSVRNTKKVVVVGEDVYIACGDKYKQTFCTLYNPSERLMFTNRNTDCSYRIPTVAMEDIGVWKCITGNEYGLQTITYTVELTTEIGKKPVETWANETDSTFNIGCRVPGFYHSSPADCKLTLPNQQILTPRPGMASDRYLTMGTNLNYAICSIEIPKPLQDFEIGIWRCELFVGIPVGDFINVTATHLPDYPKRTNVTLQLSQQYKIQCQVPYSSEYCHIKAPNGTIYPAINEDETRLGICSLNPVKINATDNGTWTCSFARTTGIPDEEIYLEITVAEVFQYYRIAEVDVGSTATLMCKSGGLPFKYCRYIAPSGKAYHITNHQTSSSISYFGRGLEYGECGITIANAQTSDNGYWTCVARIGSDFKQPEIKAQIMLEVTPSLFDDPNLAAAIGIGVGVVVVTSILAGVAVQKWRRRRHAEVAGTDTAPRQIQNVDDDNNSETLDIFSMVPTPRSYTNPESVRDDSHAHQL